MTTVSQSLINSFLEKVKNRKNVEDDTKELLNSFTLSLNNLNTSAYDYILSYEKYIDDNLVDATLLKDKLKDIIIKVERNE